MTLRRLQSPSTRLLVDHLFGFWGGVGPDFRGSEDIFQGLGLRVLGFGV